MNHLKRMGGHYLALILLVLLLILTLTWFYQFFLIHFGSVIALVMLGLLLTGEIVLMMRGAVYTSRIHRMLREQADKAGHALFVEKEKPTLFKILDMDLHPIAIAVPEKTEISKVRLEIQKLLDTLTGHLTHSHWTRLQYRQGEGLRVYDGPVEGAVGCAICHAQGVDRKHLESR